MRTFLVLITCFSVIAGSQAQESQQKRKWVIPDHLIGQYAGSIGFASVGAGYDLFKRKRANLDLLVGHVPRFVGSRPITSINLKFSTLPVKVRVNDNLTLYPLTAGAYFCYTIGKDYTSRLPSWYPENYYWWSEAIRSNIFIGGSAKFGVKGMKAGSRISAYYEVGTNEIKLVSYAQNKKELNVWNILHAGIGVKYHFAQ